MVYLLRSRYISFYCIFPDPFDVISDPLLPIDNDVQDRCSCASPSIQKAKSPHIAPRHRLTHPVLQHRHHHAQPRHFRHRHLVQASR